MDMRSLWEETLQSKLMELLDHIDLELKADNSEFTVVDGEEGDYRIIKYMDKDNKLVAIKTVEGGDNESTEVTSYGKIVIAMKLSTTFKQLLQKYISGE